MTNNEPIIYQPEVNSPTMKTMITSGSLEDWKREVVARGAPHDYLVTALSASFAGTLIKPAREDSKGLHIYGGSSRGKTTLLQVAASVWGNGSDTDKSRYMQRWNATLNAFEGLCMAHNDILMCLDEIHSCNAKDLRKVIYDTFGGSGKNAMSANRELKDHRDWRVFVLSSGEKSIRQAIEEEGKTVTAGVLVRLLDIPIVGNIIPDATTAQAIKAACSEFYGVAGNEFIQRLLVKYKTSLELSTAVINIRDAAIPTFPTTNSPTKGRALKHFAFIKMAGFLMVELLALAPYGITIERVNDSVNFVAQAWLDGAEMLPDIERAIQSVRNFILEHRESRFYVLPEDKRPGINKIAGYWDKALNRYHFVDPGWTEACKGFNELEVAKEFSQRRYLFKNNGRNLKAKFSPGAGGADGERLNGYTVEGSLLFPDELENEALSEA